MSVKTSYIKGKGLVVFGGSISIALGHNSLTGNPMILFSELKEQREPGGAITEEDLAAIEKKGQIAFEIDSVESINVIRFALDRVENYLNNKKDYGRE